MHLGLGFGALLGIKQLKSPGWNLARVKRLATSQPLSYSKDTGNAGLEPPLGILGKQH